MSPVKPDDTPQLTYTPDQMKQVLEEALSPLLSADSPLLRKSGPARVNPRPAYSSSSSSSSSDESSTDLAKKCQKPPNERTPLVGRANKIPHTPGLAPGSSPIRPLPSPSPIRNGEGTPMQTFEVEASFLQAMIGLLERQASIVPDHMLTRSDVRKIVRKELAKQSKAKDAEEKAKEAKSLSELVTPSRILGTTAGAAGIAVLARAEMRHPEEFAWVMDGAWKGGVCGFVAAMMFKGALWGFEKLSVHNSDSAEQQA